MKENDKELLILANIEKDLKQIYKNAGSFYITLTVPVSLFKLHF